MDITHAQAGTGELFYLRLPNCLYTVRIAKAAAREAGRELGFTKKLEGIELVIEEATTNVLSHAYDPAELAFYEVSARFEEESLIFRVHDRGMPMASFDLPTYDPADPDSKGLGTHLMKMFCDGFRYMNLGLDGKAFEFLFLAPNREGSVTEPAAPSTPEVIDLTGRQVDIRLFRDEDAPQVARCLYNTYRYSYVRDFLYIPEKMIRLNRSGEIQSIVATLEDGDLIGHIAIIKKGNAKTAETGQAFVSPRVRGGGIYKRLKAAVKARSAEIGLTGSYAQTVTVHPYTQKVNLDSGGRETALHLAYVPAEVQFKGIKDGLSQRLPVLIIYTVLRKEPTRRIFAPRHHKGMIRKIYDNIAVGMTFRKPAKGYVVEQSRFDFDASQTVRSAHIRIHVAGQDLLPKMRDLLRFFHHQKMELILAELSFNDPSIDVATIDLESLGFLFSGIMPHGFEDSDSLCLQYLRVWELRKQDVVLYSSFARDLLDYIIGQARDRFTVVDEAGQTMEQDEEK